MSTFRKLFAILWLTSCLVACGGTPLPPTPEPFIQPPPPDSNCVLQSGTKVPFNVNGTFPSDATFKWEAQSGTFAPEDKSLTYYTPDKLSTDQQVTISVKVTSNGSTTPYTLNCQVKADLNAVAAAATTATVNSTPSLPPESSSPTSTVRVAPSATVAPSALATPSNGGVLPKPIALTDTTATEPGPNDLIIALVSTWSGNPPYRGPDIFGAAQLIAELNHSNSQLAPLHRTVWLKAFDDMGDPAVGAQIAATIAADEHYIAVVGHNRSDVLEKALPFYNQHNMPVITVAATKKELTTGPDNSNSVLVRTVGRDDVQAKVAADYITTTLVKEPNIQERLQGRQPTVYVVYDGSAYGKGLQQEFDKYKGNFTILDTEEYSSTQQSNIIRLIVSNQPDIVFFPGYETQVGPFLKEMMQAFDAQKLPRPIMLATDGVDTPRMATLAGSAVDDMRYTSVYMSEKDLDQRERVRGSTSLAKAFRTRFGVAPPALLGESSDGMALCLTTIAIAAADGSIDREEIRRGLHAFVGLSPFVGRTGDYRFTSQGDPTESFYYVRKAIRGATVGTWPSNDSVYFVEARPPS